MRVAQKDEIVLSRGHIFTRAHVPAKMCKKREQQLGTQRKASKSPIVDMDDLGKTGGIDSYPI